MRPLVNKVVDIRNGAAKMILGGIDYYIEKHFTKEDSAGNKSPKTENKRKQVKRREAQLRQEKYKATKKLVEEIEKTEAQISALEKEKIKLEKDLAEESVYSNSVKLKETNLRYLNVKEELETNLVLWTELSDKLDELNKRFET